MLEINILDWCKRYVVLSISFILNAVGISLKRELKNFSLDEKRNILKTVIASCFDLNEILFLTLFDKQYKSFTSI